MSKILVTGATGLIGSHLVEHLLSQNEEVYCLVRPHSNTSLLSTLPVKLRSGDIKDLPSLREACQDMDAIIHIAAHVADWGGWEDFKNSNIDGTLNILQAAKENKISNTIITGSISCYGEENFNGIKDENYPYNSHYSYFLDKLFPCKMNYYRDSKALGCQQAINFARENNLNLTVIHPAWVYGEREFHSGFFEYLKLAKSKIPFLPGSSRNKFHSIYAGNLARAYYLALQKKLLGIHQFLIADQEVPTLNNFYRLFCRELGIKKPGNLPKWLIYPTGFLWELVYTILKIKSPPLLSRGRVNIFYDNIEYSSLKAQKELQFKSELSLNEAIAQTAAWYRQRNLL